MNGERDVTSILVELTLERKGHALPGLRLLAHGAGKQVRRPRHHALRRAARGPQTARGCRASGIGGSVPATCFPTGSALGSSGTRTWCAGSVKALGREARAQGVAVLLGPGINLKRSPLCGRNFEYLPKTYWSRVPWCGHGERHPEPGRGCQREALCR